MLFGLVMLVGMGPYYQFLHLLIVLLDHDLDLLLLFLGELLKFVEFKLEQVGLLLESGVMNL